MNSIGLGIDYQHRDSYQKPLPALIEGLAQRISHISVVGLQTERDVHNFTQMTNLPLLHHFTGVAPAGVYGVQMDALRHQREISRKIQALWCLEDIGVWNIGPYNIPYFAPPVLCEAVLQQTIAGVKAIQREVDVPFLAEVPSCSFVAGDISLGDFFQRLVSATACGVVLDVSHVYSYAIYTGTPVTEALASFPLQNVIEIHIAGGSVHPTHTWRYRDTHVEPVLPEVIETLANALPLCPALRAVTYEIGQGMNVDLIDRELNRLQAVADSVGFHPRLTACLTHV